MNIVETLEFQHDDYQGHGPLWHGTDLLSLLLILKDNYLDKSFDKPDGISLTYDLRAAWGFADRSTYIFEGNHCHYHEPKWTIGELPSYRGAVIELDSDKLRTKYKLINYKYDDLFFKDDEMEVRVLGNDIRPLTSFMISFSFRPEDIQWFSMYLRSPYGKEIFNNPEQMNEILLQLPHHPLFKVL